MPLSPPSRERREKRTRKVGETYQLVRDDSQGGPAEAHEHMDDGPRHGAREQTVKDNVVEVADVVKKELHMTQHVVG